MKLNYRTDKNSYLKAYELMKLTTLTPHIFETNSRLNFKLFCDYCLIIRYSLAQFSSKKSRNLKMNKKSRNFAVAYVPKFK